MTELAERLRQHFERAAASRWASAPLSEWDGPRLSRQPPAPSPAEPKRPAPTSDPRALNPWLTPEQGEMVRDAMARMAPAAGPPGEAVAKPPDTGKLDTSGVWWRTVSANATRCGTCAGEIAPGERFAYSHDTRSVLCRDCGGDVWANARPSRKLREYADARRNESRAAA